MIRPFGLFHEDKVLPKGSLNFIISFIEFLICVIFLLFNFSLAIILSLIFLDLALAISFLFEFKIDRALVFKYWLNCFKTEFLLSIFTLDKCREASFAFSPILSMYKFLDIFILLPNHPYE